MSCSFTALVRGGSNVTGRTVIGRSSCWRRTSSASPRRARGRTTIACVGWCLTCADVCGKRLPKSRHENSHATVCLALAPREEKKGRSLTSTFRYANSFSPESCRGLLVWPLLKLCQVGLPLFLSTRLLTVVLWKNKGRGLTLRIWGWDVNALGRTALQDRAADELGMDDFQYATKEYIPGLTSHPW